MRFLSTIGLIAVAVVSMVAPSRIARAVETGSAIPQEQLPPKDNNRHNNDAVLAKVGNHDITRADLIRSQTLFQADYQFYLAESDALKKAIDNQLLEQEARKEHLTVDQLLDRHVKSQVNLSEDNLKFYYSLLAASKPNIPPYNNIKNELRKDVSDVLERHARQAYLKQLQQQAGVRIMLQPPKAHLDLANAPSLGPTNAPVTIVEFADFQCPYCRKVEPQLEKLRKQYPDKVRFVYENFPLPMHDHAQKAAEAAACAAAQDRFWPYHDRLFATGAGLDIPALKKLAASLGLDTARFNKCLDSGEEAATVHEAMEQGKRLGVSATPSFFINGHFVSGALSYDALHDLVEDELASEKAAGTSSPALSVAR